MTCHYPYGAKRVFDGSALPTDYTFTGQKSDDSTGLMYYGARYYDATLGRFTQADTIIPNVMDPQSFNRYAYTLNNPVRYTDPTGHMVKDEDDNGGGSTDTEHASEEDEYTITTDNADDYYQPSADSAGEPTPNDDTSEELHDKVRDVFENPDPNKASGQALVELMAQGYDYTQDSHFDEFDEVTRANVVYWQTMHRWQQEKDAGVALDWNEVVPLVIEAGVIAGQGNDPKPVDILMPGGQPIGKAGKSRGVQELPENEMLDTFNALKKNGTSNNRAGYDGEGYDVEGGWVGMRQSNTYGTTMDVNVEGVTYDKIHLSR